MAGVPLPDWEAGDSPGWTRNVDIPIAVDVHSSHNTLLIDKRQHLDNWGSREHRQQPTLPVTDRVKDIEVVRDGGRGSVAMQRPAMFGGCGRNQRPCIAKELYRATRRIAKRFPIGPEGVGTAHADWQTVGRGGGRRSAGHSAGTLAGAIL